MPTQSIRSRLTTWGCVALTAGFLLPCTATANPSQRRTPLLDAARAAASREAAAMKERQPTQTPENPRTDLRTKSFFKTRAGIATIIIFGAGVGYALYSAKDDRILSEGR